MAKSKSGGTRSYIRGRVGADVYSIGKDAKGSKQQVVRSLAETVANPQTIDQMRGRMIMSTVMQAVSALKPIIDHSFDNVPKGQPSISEFISRNYALIKADVAAHPASGNEFALNEYLEKGIKAGYYIVSNGEAILPTGVARSSYGFSITLPSDNVTIGGLKSALGWSEGDYLTYVVIEITQDANENPVFTPKFVRMTIKSSLSDSTTITDSNKDALFDYEGNLSITFVLDTNRLVYSFAELAGANNGLIVSKKADSGYQHSTCVLAGTKGLPSTNANDVLPTYPVGSEMFLNGGDL